MKRGTPSHPKMKALARSLRIPLPLAVGYMELLWHFAGQYTPRGDLGRYSDNEIAEGVGWPVDLPAATLVAALIDVRFVDRSADCRLIVHDWSEHADDAVHKQLKRKGLSFADGAEPYTRNKARSVSDQSQPEPPTPLHFVETSRDMSRQITPVACLPVPVPVPEPVPEPVSGGGVLGSKRSASEPPPRSPDPGVEMETATVAEAMHACMPRGFPWPDGGDVARLVAEAGSVHAALMACAKIGSRRERPRSYALFFTVAAARPAPKSIEKVVEMPRSCADCDGSGWIIPQHADLPHEMEGTTMSSRLDWLWDHRKECHCTSRRAVAG